MIYYPLKNFTRDEIIKNIINVLKSTPSPKGRTDKTSPIIFLKSKPKFRMSVIEDTKTLIYFSKLAKSVFNSSHKLPMKSKNSDINYYPLKNFINIINTKVNTDI